jgi:RNA polymerase sigma-70 factor (ECF subfamily)
MYGQNVEDAEVEEAVQEIFIKLCNGKFSLDHSKGRFRSWLYTVTKHKVVDQLKKRKRDFKQLPEHEQLVQIEEEPAEWGRDYRARILDYTLPKVRESVTPKNWHCFEQYFLKNRKAADIATDVEVGGLTSNAICVNALRVMDKVRAKCTEYLGEFDDV